MTSLNQISGNIIDVLNETIYPGTIYIESGQIVGITKDEEQYDTYILPGFVDAHVHIESSMLTPCEFARMAVPHGTVATVSDPHEIGNVCGLEGVYYMLDNAKNSPFKFYFGAPSCVPATTFETAGATITVDEIEELFQKTDIKYLSEMMNFPGVLFKDPVVMAKIELAKKYGKLIDGHAPALRGEDAKKYIDAGISTDHECFTFEEALEKLQYGMKILIREGSAAKNYEALIPLLADYPDSIMFCSDDKHPNDLVDGHINQLVVRSLQRGLDLMKVLRCACVNPVKHYGLEVGLLQEGDPADFIVIDKPDADHFNVLETYINGQLWAEKGKTLLTYQVHDIINNFNCNLKRPNDFTCKAEGTHLKVIEALEGQLITNSLQYEAKIEGEYAVSDPERDVLKLVMVNRYNDAPPAICFIKNFGLQKGAIASSVGHDSHNIIAVGVSDEDICTAVNLVIEEEGGLSVAAGKIQEILPLPLAGIMTNENGYKVAEAYTKIDRLTKQLGTKLYAPYMTLSFMGLLVIPSLKLSDLGLFDGNKFAFTPLFETGVKEAIENIS